MCQPQPGGSARVLEAAARSVRADAQGARRIDGAAVRPDCRDAPSVGRSPCRSSRGPRRVARGSVVAVARSRTDAEPRLGSAPTSRSACPRAGGERRPAHPPGDRATRSRPPPPRPRPRPRCAEGARDRRARGGSSSRSGSRGRSLMGRMVDSPPASRNPSVAAVGGRCHARPVEMAWSRGACNGRPAPGDIARPLQRRSAPDGTGRKPAAPSRRPCNAATGCTALRERPVIRSEKEDGTCRSTTSFAAPTRLHIPEEIAAEVITAASTQSAARPCSAVSTWASRSAPCRCCPRWPRPTSSTATRA